MRRDLFPNGLAGIIFDCDGVMIDSEDANRFYFNSILGALGLPPMTDQQEGYSFMATAAEALRKLVPPQMQDRIDGAVERVNYARDVLPRIKLMPGFLDFIRMAHAAGLRMSIDTNRVDPGIKRVLDFFSLPNYFNPIISASVAAPKPSPEGAEQVARIWQVPPDRILFVGDSETDKQAARGAGAVFAAFGDKGLEGDLETPDFASLARDLAPWLRCGEKIKETDNLEKCAPLAGDNRFESSQAGAPRHEMMHGAADWQR